eukprot:CAMPEP_0184373162 /NCGR_PEP_ID=MMETSP1089-20130417/164345_1 /TAXON_ID=38269 ORGANISM="Gloeochaete wittrockiana, Strain SAG46.84" /NCGR_SAMPLE_ID=MMETSP1089 /ASSEMBLY_ACC=CAM_ASM_000445 /LENGTH=66 /DNA_ID=CAMNT_0026716085 /DNA_START=1148 /DNA_END=1345 /DNA_ORIENTATION=+
MPITLPGFSLVNALRRVSDDNLNSVHKKFKNPEGKARAPKVAIRGPDCGKQSSHAATKKDKFRRND